MPHQALRTAAKTHQCKLPLLSLITARKRSLGQGNVFTGVCLSTGGLASQHASLVTWPRGVSASRGVGQTPLQENMGYAQRAGRTHPTWMRSCLLSIQGVRSNGDALALRDQIFLISWSISGILTKYRVAGPPSPLKGIQDRARWLFYQIIYQSIQKETEVLFFKYSVHVYMSSILCEDQESSKLLSHENDTNRSKWNVQDTLSLHNISNKIHLSKTKMISLVLVA